MLPGRDRAAARWTSSSPTPEAPAALAPETILTEANEAWITPEQREKLIQSHPVRRLGTPDDVARAALFLASDASGWISGVVLDVAGGAVLV